MALIIRRSVSDAYAEMLRSTLDDEPFMQVTKVLKPVVGHSINIDERIHAAFEGFKFPDGRTGK